MTKLTQDAELAVRIEAERVAKQHARDEAKAFLEEERQRNRFTVKVFAGVNIVGMIVLFGALWAVTRFTTERIVEDAAKNPILAKQVEFVGTLVNDLLPKLSEAQKTANKAITDAEAAATQAREAKKIAEERVRQLNDAAAQAGDPQIADKFAQLASLAQQIKDNGTLSDLQTALRNDVKRFANERIASMLPVGTILPWHRDLDGVPKDLPSGWVPCDGPRPQDPQSSVDMTKIPNLNGQGRFLRGASKSGSLQEAELTRHSHPHRHYSVLLPQMNDFSTRQITAEDSVLARGSFGVESKYELVGIRAVPNAGLTSENSSEFGGDETRPINMSVIWIIRVK